jgi:hypothetical protein
MPPTHVRPAAPTREALAATTRADLAALAADLPEPPRRAGVSRAPRLRAEWSHYAVVAVVLLAVWALAGAGAFWPACPLGFWSLALLMKAGAPRRATPGRG